MPWDNVLAVALIMGLVGLAILIVLWPGVKQGTRLLKRWGVPDPDDARARLVRPTPLGCRELVRAAAELSSIRAEWESRLGDGLTVDDVLAALQVLIDVCEARERDGFGG